MRRRKELDKTISAIVLILYAVVWLIQFIVAMSQGGNPSNSVVTALSVIRNIIQVAVVIVLLYNAWGWSGNLIYRIVMLAIAAWLILCMFAPYIPGLEAIRQYMYPLA